MKAILLFAGSFGRNASADAYSVGANAYTIGKVSLNPSTAAPGASVSITGAGELPSAELEVSMGGRNSADGQTYYAILGTAVTDSQGNWSFKFNVPANVKRLSDNATIPIFTAGWPVGGTAVGADGGLYKSFNYLDVNMSSQQTGTTAQPASTGAATNTFVSSGPANTGSGATLPNTGARIAALFLAGISLAGFGALALRLKNVSR